MISSSVFFKFSMLRRMPACCHISSLTRLHIKTAGGWERDAGMGGSVPVPVSTEWTAGCIGFFHLRAGLGQRD